MIQKVVFILFSVPKYGCHHFSKKDNYLKTCFSSETRCVSFFFFCQKKVTFLKMPKKFFQRNDRLVERKKKVLPLDNCQISISASQNTGKY